MTFDEFVADQLGPLSRYARVLCGDRQAAHDLVADTLVAASERWERVSQNQHTSAYVRRMLTNRYLDHLRRYRRASRIRTLLEASPPVTTDQINAVDRRDFVDGLLQELPSRQRAAVVLRFLLERPDTEIAQELGIAVGTVRSDISRGLATLRSKTTPSDVRTHLQ